MPASLPIRLICATACAAALAGCGIKGPLYLPGAAPQRAPKAPQSVPSAPPDVSKPSPGSLPDTPDQPGQ
jgi:predicted small lipoprotein YifL